MLERKIFFEKKTWRERHLEEHIQLEGSYRESFWLEQGKGVKELERSRELLGRDFLFRSGYRAGEKLRKRSAEEFFEREEEQFFA